MPDTPLASTTDCGAGCHAALLPIVGSMGGRRLEPHQKEIIDRAAGFVAEISA